MINLPSRKSNINEGVIEDIYNFVHGKQLNSLTCCETLRALDVKVGPWEVEGPYGSWCGRNKFKPVYACRRRAMASPRGLQIVCIYQAESRFCSMRKIPMTAPYQELDLWIRWLACNVKWDFNCTFQKRHVSDTTSTLSASPTTLTT